MKQLTDAYFSILRLFSSQKPEVGLTSPCDLQVFLTSSVSGEVDHNDERVLSLTFSNWDEGGGLFIFHSTLCVRYSWGEAEGRIGYHYQRVLAFEKARGGGGVGMGGC